MITHEIYDNVNTRLEYIALDYYELKITYFLKLIVNRKFPIKMLDLFLTRRYLVDNLLIDA